MGIGEWLGRINMEVSEDDTQHRTYISRQFSMQSLYLAVFWLLQLKQDEKRTRGRPEKCNERI